MDILNSTEREKKISGQESCLIHESKQLPTDISTSIFQMYLMLFYLFTVQTRVNDCTYFQFQRYDCTWKRREIRRKLNLLFFTGPRDSKYRVPSVFLESTCFLSKVYTLAFIQIDLSKNLISCCLNELSVFHNLCSFRKAAICGLFFTAFFFRSFGMIHLFSHVNCCHLVPSRCKRKKCVIERDHFVQKTFYNLSRLFHSVFFLILFSLDRLVRLLFSSSLMPFGRQDEEMNKRCKQEYILKPFTIFVVV
jgi:hypothetical protein